MAAHEQEFFVYHADTDATGVMFHANHLVFAERARTDALRARGAPVSELIAEHGLHFLVRRVEIDYWRPLRLDDRVVLRTTAGRLGASTCPVRHDFTVGGVSAARALVLLVSVRAGSGHRSGRPARIPPRWREVLAGLQEPLED